jgi:hypothetical protein
MLHTFELFPTPESLEDPNWRFVTTGTQARQVVARSESDARQLLHQRTLIAGRSIPGQELQAPWLSPSMSVCRQLD